MIMKIKFKCIKYRNLSIKLRTDIEWKITIQQDNRVEYHDTAR